VGDGTTWVVTRAIITEYTTFDGKYINEFYNHHYANYIAISPQLFYSNCRIMISSLRLSLPS